MPKWIFDNSLDQKILYNALKFAKKIHSHQKRKNEEPYIIHPIAVANILYEIGLGTSCIAVGLMHDTLEDALDKNKAHLEIKSLFNSKIYNLVKALTKCDSIPKDKIQDIYLKQIIEYSKKDISVIFVKVADLLHNLSTIEYLKPEKRDKWISELRNGFIPILKNSYYQMTPSYKKSYDRLMDKLVDYLYFFS
jgi:guanosine-3',5'-bis(diphosphate) 3'-pyrophosphohydrolase